MILILCDDNLRDNLELLLFLFEHGLQPRRKWNNVAQQWSLDRTWIIVLMSHADARVLNNLFWLIIVISCWAVLNSNNPLLRWVIVAFDERISIMILARWSVTVHNYNPLISLTIPICSWKAIMVNWIIQVHYSRQIITIST